MQSDWQTVQALIRLHFWRRRCLICVCIVCRDWQSDNSGSLLYIFPFEAAHDKTNKMTVRPAATQISLGIRPVWSVFAVHSIAKDPRFLHVDSEDSDWANALVILLVLSCSGSFTSTFLYLHLNARNLIWVTWEASEGHVHGLTVIQIKICIFSTFLPFPGQWRQMEELTMHLSSDIWSPAEWVFLPPEFCHH